MFMNMRLGLALIAVSALGIDRAWAEGPTAFTRQTPCAALLFYTQADNRGAPTDDAKARMSSLLEMMKPYTDALHPYVPADQLFRQIFTALDTECQKDQGETLGDALKVAGHTTIDATNRDLKAAGKPDHIDYPKE